MWNALIEIFCSRDKVWPLIAQGRVKITALVTTQFIRENNIVKRLGLGMGMGIEIEVERDGRDRDKG